MDRPLILRPAAVRAILAGPQTQSIRLNRGKLPKYEIGDCLYVREGFRGNQAYDIRAFYEGGAPLKRDVEPYGLRVEYLADQTHYLDGKTRVSLHMPRWASRITLIVKSVHYPPDNVELIVDVHRRNIDEKPYLKSVSAHNVLKSFP